MILIFGGAYQGKLTYALERFAFGEDDVYRCSDCNDCAPEGMQIIYEIDKWLLALVKAGIDTTGAAQELIRRNPDAVIICNDVSCGVVPADPQLRLWRETVGRTLAKLSWNSAEVIRMFCGIPMRIK